MENQYRGMVRTFSIAAVTAAQDTMQSVFLDESPCSQG